MSLGKAALTTPLYISLAWTLLVSYQLFTQTAVSTFISSINMFWPSVGTWLSFRIDIIVFIHAFAWIFVLSSVIPSAILGKERSVLAQFFVCLTLTFVAFMVQDAINTYGGGLSDQLLSLATLFYDPYLAVGYLIMPYLLMLVFDIQTKKNQKRKEELETTRATCLENAVAEEQNLQEAE
jgi:hypothetical protein